MNPKNESFLDMKTVLAILLVGASWVGWQVYMSKKYPNLNQPKASQQVGEEKPVKESPSVDGVDQPAMAKGQEGGEALAPAEVALENEFQKKEIVVFENDKIQVEISSIGMGLQKIRLKKFTDRKDQTIQLAEGFDSAVFSTRLNGIAKPLNFKMSKIDEKTVVGTAQLAGARVTKKLVLDLDNYRVEGEVKAEALPASVFSVVQGLSDRMNHYDAPGFFMPSFDHQEVYFDGPEDGDRIYIDSSAQGADLQRGQQAKIDILAVSSQYFAIAYSDRSNVLPDLKWRVKGPEREIETELHYPLLGRAGELSLSFMGYLGPKDTDLLAKADAKLTEVVNLGFFSWLGHPILGALKALYRMLGNWGLAIIVLTIGVRMLVLPFNVMSYKSMKKMQVIQPRLKAIREKHKDEPQKASEETMRIMREEKVNPLGGCLPMFLQLPVFFALFQVLGQSIELYKSPFFGWIQDLSSKDPYFLLPILVAAGMFLQQKITPSTMEPMQQKMMMFLPIIFVLPMASFPAGLNLYIAVSTIFGILQQKIFMGTPQTNT